MATTVYILFHKRKACDDNNLQGGLSGCGINIAHGLIRYKLGGALLEAFTTMDKHALTQFLVHWHDKLWHILGSDPDGFLDRCHLKLAELILDTFPSYEDLAYYFSPQTSLLAHSSNVHALACEVGSSQPSLAELTTFCGCYFGLEGKALIVKMHATVWEGAAV